MASTAGKRWLKAIAQLIVVGGTLAFVASTLLKHWGELRASVVEPRPWLIVAAVPFGVLYLVGRGVVWHHMTRRLVGTFPLRFDIAAWCYSTLGKYIPGKVFMLLGRVYLYSTRGANVVDVNLAFLVELGVLTLTAALLFVGASFSVGLPEVVQLRGVAVAVALALLVLAHPRVHGFAIRLLERMKKTTTGARPMRMSDVLRWTLFMFLTWLVQGFGCWLLAASLTDLPLSTMPYLTGAFAVAGMAGIYAVFAPSGLGVRESVLLLTLAPLLGAGPAAALAVLARVWITVAELLAALVGALSLGVSPIPGRRDPSSTDGVSGSA